MIWPETRILILGTVLNVSNEDTLLAHVCDIQQSISNPSTHNFHLSLQTQ